MKMHLYKVLGLATVIPFISCDRKPETPAPPAKVETLEWDWSKYNRAKTFELGTFQVSLQPKQSIELTANYAGILTILQKEKVTQVPKDYLFAEMDKEKLAQDKLRLDIGTRKQTLEADREETIDRPEKLKKATEELEEARQTVKLMKRVIGSKTLQKRASQLFNGKITHVTKKVLADAKRDLALAEKKFKSLNEIDDILWKDQATLLDMDLEDGRNKYKKAKEAAAYKTPFAGELRIELDYVANKDEYNVNARQIIATLNDYTKIHAALDVQNVSWIDLNPNSLSVHLKNRERTKLDFDSEKVEKNKHTRIEEKKYVFAIPLKSNETLKRLAGTNMNAKLITELGETCFIVPKLDLSAFVNQHKITSFDYGEIADQLWPGAKVLAESSTNLAIYYHVPRK